MGNLGDVVLGMDRDRGISESSNTFAPIYLRLDSYVVRFIRIRPSLRHHWALYKQALI